MLYYLQNKRQYKQLSFTSQKICIMTHFLWRPATYVNFYSKAFRILSNIYVTLFSVKGMGGGGGALF